ncbi:unnamed protein product, partial [Mesorhabditis spiculigera]
MVSPALKTIAYRGLLPAALVIAAFIRPSFLSLIYLILALVGPILPSTTGGTPLNAPAKIYAYLAFLISTLAAFAQIAFQIYIGAQDGQQSTSDCDDELYRWLRQAGFIRHFSNMGFDTIRGYMPEVIAFAFAFLNLIVVQCMGHSIFVEHPASVHVVRSGSSHLTQKSNIEAFSRALLIALKRLSNAVLFVLVAFAGCIQPSLLNSVYFLTFMAMASWWSTYKGIKHSIYNRVKIGLLMYSAAHLIVVYTYQIPEVSKLLPEEDTAARLIGLSSVLKTDCEDSMHVYVNDKITWNVALNPLVIIVFYLLLVIQLCWTRNGTRHYLDDDDTGSSIHEELLDTEERVGPQEHVPMRKITSQIIDKQKISHIFNSPGERQGTASQGLITAIGFFVEHSYVWALLYHSTFGLTLLAWACIIWMFRDTRNVSFTCSPFILAYVEFLLVVQYIWSMDLPVLPTVNVEGGTADVLAMIGFIKYTGSDVILSLPIFLLHRLKRRDVYYSRLTEHEKQRRLNYGTFGSHRPSVSATLLPLCGCRQLAQPPAHRLLDRARCRCPPPPGPLTDRSSFINIGFFVLWTLGVLQFKLSFRFFRGTAYAYWSLLVLYTSLVIIAIYVWQFKNFPELIGWSDSWTRDIGLIHYAHDQTNKSLFVRLLVPISLFVVTMLQLKFFHDPWADAVQPVRADAGGEPQAGASAQPPVSLSTRLSRIAEVVIELLWRAVEVHIAKIVFLIIIYIASKNICAMYVPVVILVAVGLLLPRGASGLLGLFLTTYLALAAVAKMVFQLNFIDATWFGNGTECNASDPQPTPFEWFGFKKHEDTGSMFAELGGLVVSIVALTAQSVVIYRQRARRIRFSEPPANRHRIFPELDPITYDHNVWNCLKFFADFGFYKFGLECCLVMIAINAWVRMDMLGALATVWLAVFALSKRPLVRWIWPLFLLYLVVILPLQYAVYVGFPPSLCIPYPWSMLFDNAIKSRNLLIWLGLADYDIHWTSANIFADFFLLLFVSCQAAVFRTETAEHPAGDNESIYKDGVYSFKPNPRADFVTTQRSFVDYFKKFIFLYAQWLTLVAVMVAGLGGTSLFALGYLCLAFWILWSGNALFIMRDHNKTIRKFMVVLGYTVFSMFCKVSLQVLGCVFLENLFYVSGPFNCIIRQIFSVTCVNTLATQDISLLFTEAVNFDKNCPVSAAETRIGFDTLALAFLVFQMRIFHSWYFQHAMCDFRAEIVLANRGAVLANQLIEKEMKEQKLQQDQKVSEIKQRTAAIREQYKRQQERGRTFEPKTYGQAKRAGDYYMFEYDPEADELIRPIDSFVPEVDPEGSEFRRLDPTQLVHTAINKDLDMVRSMRQVEKAELIKDDEQRMIAAVSEDEQPAPVVVESGDADSQEPAEQPPKQDESFIYAGLRFVFKVVYNSVEWMAVFLNRRSREHRYVAYVLGKEKQELKSKFGQTLCDSSKNMGELRDLVPVGALHVVRSETDIERLENEALLDWQRRNVIARFFNAFGDCVNAHTDVICYVLAILAHAACAGLITMPLPLLVFFWGTLSNPRPSKMFWIVLIAYTELIIIIKFIFQFRFFDFNTEAAETLNGKDFYAWNKILGLQKKDYYAFFDVFLLIFLFYHRYNLRRLGLWKDANVSDTFSGNTTAYIDPQEIQSAMLRGESVPIKFTFDKYLENSVDNRNGENTDNTEQEESADQTTSTNPFARFFAQLFHPKFFYIRDLYPFMFALDIVCFFVITFGYSSFGEGGSGNVVSDIQSNRIPLTFVIMLISLTLMIVIDRGLYLRKAVYCKVVYQLVTIIFMHVWIFLVLPSITKTSAASNTMASFLYFVKCIYLLVSAWQIRNGYPALCIGNLLTHAYGLTNMVFFKIFMAVPFLFELRTAIDWTWTDTSMPLFDFFNMENFYSTIYNLKCGRQFEQSYPAPRGEAKGSLIKYLMGIPMILFIVIIIWCPLIAFSLLNRLGTVLTPNTAQMTISVEGYPPLYSIQAQGNELRPLTFTELDGLKTSFSKAFLPGNDSSVQKSRSAVSFLDDYSPADTLKVLFRPESEQLWDISKESLEAMRFALQNQTNDMEIQVRVSFTRPRQDSSKEPVTHTSEFSYKMPNNSVTRQQLVAALMSSGGEVIVPNAIPVYLIVPNEGEVTPSSVQLEVLAQYLPDTATVHKTYANISLKMEKRDGGGFLWTAHMINPSFNTTGINSSQLILPAEKVHYRPGNEDYVQLVSFVDRTFPSFFAKYVQGGVIAMYLALVIVVGKVLRGLFTNQPLDVIISEIPNPDHLLKICLDIYLVREAKDFVLEQDLFAKLIFLFRSPATLIKWTRYKIKDE